MKYHYTMIVLIRFLAVAAFLIALNVLVPAQASNSANNFNFEFETVKDEEGTAPGGGRRLYVLVTEEDFNRENLSILFDDLSRSDKTPTLSVTVYTRVDALIERAAWMRNRPQTSSVIYIGDESVIDTSRPETGFSRAYFFRDGRNEYFAYSRGPQYLDLIFVRKRSSRTPTPDRDFLLYSVKSGFISGVEWIVKQKGIDLNAVDERGSSPLAWAVWRNHNRVAEILIKAGADVNGPTSSGQPIFTAIDARNVEGVQLLIENGADVNAVIEQFGKTPLMAAAVYCHVEIAELLISAGARIADKDLEGKTALDRSCSDMNLRELLASDPKTVSTRETEPTLSLRTNVLEKTKEEN